MTPSMASALAVVAGLTVSLWTLGLTTRVKSVVAGRAGPPLLQRYRDILKLLGKSAVYSETTTAVFRAAPIISLASVVLALCLVPFGTVGALIHFRGDFFVLAGLLALGRFVTMLAAMDTGSPFEGMGASREAQFSALLEPVFLLSLAALAKLTDRSSLTAIAQQIHHMDSTKILSVATPVAVALAVVYVVENARMPVDDPTTHLELTMIHEVMILDHSGPDLAFIEYAAAIKQWIFGALLAGLLAPLAGVPTALSPIVAAVGIACIAVAVGLFEAVASRLRLVDIPGVIVGAGAATTVAILMTEVVR